MPDPVVVAAVAAGHGWPVLAIRSGSKKPVRSGGDNHRAAWLTTPQAVVLASEGIESARGWTRASSFSVVTGESLDGDGDGLALVALDLDGDADGLEALLAEAGPEARQWASSTLKVQRCADRAHYYGTLPADACPPTTRLTPGLEWRGRGGYILLAASKHPSGARYRITQGEEVLTAGEAPAACLFDGVVADESGPQVRWRRVLPVPAGLLEAVRRRRPEQAASGLEELAEELAELPDPEPVSGPLRASELASGPVAGQASKALQDGSQGAAVSRPVEPSAGLAAAYERRTLEGIVADLDEAAGWPVGHRDDRGRGWEKLTADAARRLARLALADWSELTLTEAERVLTEHAPTGAGWGPRDVADKWRSQLRRAHAAGPLELPHRDDEAVEVLLTDASSAKSPTTKEEEPTVTATEAEAEKPAGRRVTSWRGVDLSAIVAGLQAGNLERPRPTVGQLTMSDDQDRCLFYRARINGIAGESNAGKTWTALAVSRQEIEAGRAVIYLDFEDGPVGVVSRLLEMGANPDAITERFHYVGPTERLGMAEWLDLAELLDAVEPSLVVVDSTGEGLSLSGANPNADDDVARWFREVPRRIADHGSEPAVVLLDHVTKSADDRGLWAIGSQRKRAAISGAQYVQNVVKSFSREREGFAVLVCAKDRHGHYRSGQRVAHLNVTPEDGGATVGLDLVFLPDSAPLADGEKFRPTVLMEKLSRYLEQHPGEADRTQYRVRKEVTGKTATITEALDVLVTEGFVTTSKGARNSTIYTSTKSFRVADDKARQQGDGGRDLDRQVS